MERTLKNSLFYVILIVLGSQVIGVILQTIIMGLKLLGESDALLAGLIISELVMFVPLFKRVKEDRGEFLLTDELVQIKRHFVPTVIIGIVTQYIVLFGYSGTSFIFDFVPKGTQIKGSVIMLIVFSGLIAPIFEELTFRAVLYSEVRKKKSFMFTTILTSALFTLFHFDFSSNIIFYLTMGFLFAYIYEKLHSIMINIIIHSLNNLIAIINQNAINKELASWIYSLGWLCLIIAMILVIVLIACLLFMNFKKNNQ